MGMGGERHVRSLYRRERDPILIAQEAGWAPGTLWTGAENLPSTGSFSVYSLVLWLYLFYVLIVLHLAFRLLFKTHNTNIHAPAGFEPAISAGERPQPHALDRTAIEIGQSSLQRVDIPNELSRPTNVVLQYLLFLTISDNLFC